LKKKRATKWNFVGIAIPLIAPAGTDFQKAAKPGVLARHPAIHRKATGSFVATRRAAL
jgi:hypothetical protein